uniref:LITAF domain-containing protein n=1 Tax=Fundulus heteroclitus TaxID=8078 RepID=A0A3Q2THT8_FUNHE
MKRCTKKDEDHDGGSSEEREFTHLYLLLSHLKVWVVHSDVLPQLLSRIQKLQSAQVCLTCPLPSLCLRREAERLGPTAGLTKCPSCSEVVVTETQSAVSETMWILCFLCVAGCCVVPFFMKRLRNVRHQCPQCQAKIHTHQPL